MLLETNMFTPSTLFVTYGQVVQPWCSLYEAHFHVPPNSLNTTTSQKLHPLCFFLSFLFLYILSYMFIYRSWGMLVWTLQYSLCWSQAFLRATQQEERAMWAMGANPLQPGSKSWSHLDPSYRVFASHMLGWGHIVPPSRPKTCQFAQLPAFIQPTYYGVMWSCSHHNKL